MSRPGLNDGDRERIAKFLSKPSHERDLSDLVPPGDPDEEAATADGEDGDADGDSTREPDALDGE